MESARAQAAARRLRQAIDLHTAGISLKRAQLRREHPDADEAEIRRLLEAWLWERPGAEWGDTVGRHRPIEDR